MELGNSFGEVPHTFAGFECVGDEELSDARLALPLIRKDGTSRGIEAVAASPGPHVSGYAHSFAAVTRAAFGENHVK